MWGALRVLGEAAARAWFPAAANALHYSQPAVSAPHGATRGRTRRAASRSASRAASPSPLRVSRSLVPADAVLDRLDEAERSSATSAVRHRDGAGCAAFPSAATTVVLSRSRHSPAAIWRSPSRWSRPTRDESRQHHRGDRSRHAERDRDQALPRTYAQERIIWLDGREHPPAEAPHTWMGFSTGEWHGRVLKVRTTHIKQGWHRRNGLPMSAERR